MHPNAMIVNESLGIPLVAAWNQVAAFPATDGGNSQRAQLCAEPRKPYPTAGGSPPTRLIRGHNQDNDG